MSSTNSVVSPNLDDVVIFSTSQTPTFAQVGEDVTLVFGYQLLARDDTINIHSVNAFDLKTKPPKNFLSKKIIAEQSDGKEQIYDLDYEGHLKLSVNEINVTLSILNITSDFFNLYFLDLILSGHPSVSSFPSHAILLADRSEQSELKNLICFAIENEQKQAKIYIEQGFL